MNARPFVTKTRNGFWRVFYDRNNGGCHPVYYTNQATAMKAAQRLAGMRNAWH